MAFNLNAGQRVHFSRARQHEWEALQTASLADAEYAFLEVQKQLRATTQPAASQFSIIGEWKGEWATEGGFISQYHMRFFENGIVHRTTSARHVADTSGMRPYPVKRGGRWVLEGRQLTTTFNDDKVKITKTPIKVLDLSTFQMLYSDGALTLKRVGASRKQSPIQLDVPVWRAQFGCVLRAQA